MGSIRISASSMWASKNGVFRLVYIGQKSCTEEAREAMNGRDVKFYSLGGDGQLIEHWAATMDFLKRYVEIPFKHAVALMEKCEALPLLPPHALEIPEPPQTDQDYYDESCKAIDEMEAKKDEAYPDIVPTSLYGELVPKEGEVYIYHALNPRRIGERARIMRVELCDTTLGSADRQAGRTLTYQVYYLVNTEIDLGVQCCSKESFRQSYRLHAPHSMVDAFTHERIADE